MASGRKKRKKAAALTPEVMERIVATSLAHPEFGAQRLARVLAGEGVIVSKGSVYQALRRKGLQTRELRFSFREELRRLEEPTDSSEPKGAYEPPDEPLTEQPEQSPEPPVFEASQESPAAPVPETPPTPAKEKPETPVSAVPAHIPVPASAPRIDQIEQTAHGRERWLFRGINLLLAAFIVWLGVHIGTTLYDARREPIAAAAPPSAPDSTAGTGENLSPVRPLSDYHAIVDRNLFGSPTAPVSDAWREAADIKAITLAGNEVGLKLIGTTVAKDRRLNYAVVEVAKTRSQEIHRENDVVGNVRIKRIVRNNVIVITGSGEQRLTVDEKVSPTGGSAQEQLEETGGNFWEVRRSVGENAEVTSEIARTEIFLALLEIRQMLQESDSSLNASEGKPVGVPVGKLGSQDALLRMGLRKGDVIKGIGAKEIGGSEDAELFIERLAQGGDFPILIERDGKAQTMKVSLH
jgi:type II secretory pathway component PulC